MATLKDFGISDSDFKDMVREYVAGALDKWPQMVVVGHDVTPEQVDDILLKTDPFLTSACPYSGGNDQAFNAMYKELAGLTALNVTRKYPEGHDYIDVDWEKQNALTDALGVLPLNYIVNQQASSAYIFGAHGWCNPDGTIMSGDNVGKWPSVEELFLDWAQVARAFPYLTLTATFMSGEMCEDDRVPVFEIGVANGRAMLQAPSPLALTAVPERDFSTILSRSETGLDSARVERVAAKVRAALVGLKFIQ